MKVDYDKLAEKYDLTRTANANMIKLFAEEMPLEGKNVLDFGCGTGNFAYALNKLTNAVLYGVEPSDNMREKALAKGGVLVRKGNHSFIPYENDFFNFIYMTDVIHHVPDLAMMFAEFIRVLKPCGRICILTESHEQLETRFFVKYFPETVEIEKTRYPDISVIIKAAQNSGLRLHKTITTDSTAEFFITSEFIKLVENKGYSMFHLITESDYQKGLAALKKDYENKTHIKSSHDETLLWLKKEN